LRLHDTGSDRDLSLEAECLTWYSKQHPECKDGYAWEVKLFGYRIEPLSYVEYTSIDMKMAREVKLVPKYGLYAFEWNSHELHPNQPRYAVPMSHIGQWFKEEIWTHLGKTGRPPIEEPKSNSGL
jgi:hypothetical protein